MLWFALYCGFQETFSSHDLSQISTNKHEFQSKKGTIVSWVHGSSAYVYKFYFIFKQKEIAALGLFMNSGKDNDDEVFKSNNDEKKNDPVLKSKIQGLQSAINAKAVLDKELVEKQKPKSAEAYSASVFQKNVSSLSWGVQMYTGNKIQMDTSKAMGILNKNKYSKRTIQPELFNPCILLNP